ncbi:MAG: BREX system Lon protease-like protein BrxL, partial [Lachnospiraceae bacterium]|nr:BREX system Lon protease-like protein BrxL [Lachnospiraceae bacterium]
LFDVLRAEDDFRIVGVKGASVKHRGGFVLSDSSITWPLKKWKDVFSLFYVYHGADTRDTEAVKRIATAYLKLLFPHVQSASDISTREFRRYCLDRTRKMRDTIKYQLGLLDVEYSGKDLPMFGIREFSE